MRQSIWLVRLILELEFAKLEFQPNMELDSGKHDFSYFLKMETEIAKLDF